MSEHDNSDRPKRRISGRVEPFWLNPATIKGTVAIAVGGLFLAFPEASVYLWRTMLGTALMISGAADLWFRLRSPEAGNRIRSSAEGLLTIAAGIAFLAYPNATLRIVMLIAALYLASRGLAITTGAIRNRTGDAWQLDLARGVLFLVFAGFAFFLPQAVAEALLVALAVGAVIIGAVILVYGIQHHSDSTLVDIDAGSVTQIIRDWMMLQDVGDARRDEIKDGFYFEQPDRTNKLVAWWFMLLLSVAIATFGILQDSTAVVIGAMLIAPLMTPIIGMAGAAVNGWQSRITASLGMIAGGVGASIVLAFIIGAWAPAIVPLATNSQVTSRVNPNVIDMAIALAAGAAGAFANVNRRVSSSIAGVAIAVALVPPLGVVGLTLNAGMYEDASGASLLFLTNLVSIFLAAMIVFLFTGFAPMSNVRKHAIEVKRIAMTVLIAALLILIPLAFTATSILQAAAHQNTARDETTAWLESAPDLELVRVELHGADVSIVVTGTGEVPPLADLAEALTSSFLRPAIIEVEHIPSTRVTYSEEMGESRLLPDG
ncbi:MAG: DUF389 domain-containing protein [Actinomycetota bacterium]